MAFPEDTILVVVVTHQRCLGVAILAEDDSREEAYAEGEEDLHFSPLTLASIALANAKISNSSSS